MKQEQSDALMREFLESRQCTPYSSSQLLIWAYERGQQDLKKTATREARELRYLGDNGEVHNC